MSGNMLLFSLTVFPLFLYFMIIMSKKMNFIDKPNSRKIHKAAIVNISGLTISLYLLIVIGASEYSSHLENIIALGFILSLIGFFDDRIEMKPSTKFFLTLFPVSYLILNGYNLTDLGKYEYVHYIYLGKFSIPFTFLAVMLLVNAINYIDGTDGLLIGYSITSLLYFYFLADKNSQFLNLILIFVYILIVCLIFNFLPIKSGLKSFVGDSGSLFISFFLSFTLIFLYKYMDIHPAFLIWACWLPVYDFLHVTFNRLKLKNNFTHPDNSHLHHYILNFFSNSHVKTFLLINFINLAIICFGYFICLKVGKIYSLSLFAGLYFLYIFIKNIFIDKVIGK